MLTLADDEGEPEQIDPAHLPAVLEGLAQAKRREFASDAEVEAAFRRFDRRSFASHRERPKTSRTLPTPSAPKVLVLRCVSAGCHYGLTFERKKLCRGFLGEF